jgi:hypothetical protein
MLKLEIRNSKFGARNFNSAKAGVYEVAASRLRGNDPLGGLRISSFGSDSRILFHEVTIYEDI